MQKSTVNGLQSGSGVSVGGDVAVSTAVGAGEVGVGMIFVLTGVGVGASSELVQEISNNTRRRFEIRFITHCGGRQPAGDTLESVGLPTHLQG